jgi:mycofactocin precursor
MTDPAIDTTTDARSQGEDPRDAADDAALVEADLIVEDVSIDGMCGVY